MIKLSEWIRAAQVSLMQADIDEEDAHFEPKRIVQDVLDLSTAQLILRMDQSLDERELQRLDQVIKRRQNREPLSQILGIWEFWSLPFHVTRDTLTPRPDTEVLVEEALSWLRTSALASRGARVVDVGTGTGCVGLSLASELPHLSFELTDVCVKALKVAENNTLSLKRQDLIDPDVEIMIIQADLFQQNYDDSPPIAIVSNPPYIRQASSVDLMPEVVDYEPHIALFGDGMDGLGVIKRLTHEAVEILPSGGGLFIEVGYDQTLESAAYLTQVGFQDVRIRRDYGGQPRVVSGFKN